MERMDEITFARLARQAGFGRTGFCSARAFDAEREAVARGPEIAERRQLKFDPCGEEPRAKSLAVLLWPYLPAAKEENGCVFVDGYYFASNAAYHAAKALEEQLIQAGHFARANVSYPAREAALRAGIGVIGQNGMLITPEYGSRFVIILMATDIEPGAADKSESGGCLRCGRCAKACPAEAIDADGMSRPEKCIRNFMMEGIVAPEHLREKMGMRLIGCDICQRVCPMQPKFEPGRTLGLKLSELVTDDRTVFSAAVRKLADEIGRNAARPQRVRAQAALLAGNSGDKSYLPVLEAWAQMPFEAVAEHARWAKARLLTARLDREEKTDYNTCK